MSKTFQPESFVDLQPICKDKFYYFSELNSTSDYAKELVSKGAESGTLVLADHQSSGRGRGGNSWLSPAGEGLLFTLIIDPDVDPALWSQFSLISGLALVRAIKSLSQNEARLQLKWPNDLYLNHKKCAGILVEKVKDKLLIGIGLNLSTTDFPPEIESKATSLAHEGIILEKEQLLAAIITEIYQAGSLAGTNFSHIITAYREHCMLTGKLINFNSAGANHTGSVMKIGEDGTLIVDHVDKIIAYHEAKDITLL